MKKISSIIFIFLIIMTLQSCYSYDNINYNKVSYEFENLYDNYDIEEDKLNAYYIDDSDIMYMDIAEFLVSLDGFYQTAYYNKTVTMSLKEYTLFFYSSDGENILRHSMTIDWLNDTITVSSRTFFQAINSESLIDLLKHIDIDEEVIKEGKSKTFDLKKYDINIYYKDHLLLIPFTILNELFCSSNYYNIYFDGNKFYGTYYDLTSQDEKTYVDIIENSSLKNKEESDEERLFCYNQLLFTIDNFYGLKDYKKINTEEVLNNYKDRILSKDPLVYNKAYSDFFYTYLDELHTRIPIYSFYLNDHSKIETKYGDFYNEFKDSANKLVAQANDRLDTLDNSVYYKNDLAVIFFTSFKIDNSNDLNDTYEFIKKSLRDIMYHPGIKKIAFDISLNGGGVILSMYKTLSLFSDEYLKFYSADSMYDSVYNTVLRVDNNKDDSYDYLDTFKNKGYDFYIITGINTFSAANSFTSFAKDNKIAKIIGQKTGGGMCSVLPIILSDMTTIEMSSTNLELNKNQEYIEGGIDVDLKISYDNYYDYNKINELINNAYYN